MTETLFSSPPPRQNIGHAHTREPTNPQPTREIRQPASPFTSIVYCIIRYQNYTLSYGYRHDGPPASHTRTEQFQILSPPPPAPRRAQRARRTDADPPIHPSISADSCRETRNGPAPRPPAAAAWKWRRARRPTPIESCCHHDPTLSARPGPASVPPEVDLLGRRIARRRRRHPSGLWRTARVGSAHRSCWCRTATPAAWPNRLHPPKDRARTRSRLSAGP